MSKNQKIIICIIILLLGGIIALIVYFAIKSSNNSPGPTHSPGPGPTHSPVALSNNDMRINGRGPSMLSKLSDVQKISNSLEVLKKVNINIPERKFHDFIYILHDLRTLLGEKEKTYLEIGSYVGSSASLMLQHDFKTNIMCIDPCVLHPSHYNGSLEQRETLNKNLLNNNIHDYKIKIFQNFSNDPNLLQKLRDSNTKVDILFIDGDHTRQGVINDWNNFHQFVNPGGFICFDDYYDGTYSPEVRPAVDSIVQDIDKNMYEVIGSLENIHKLGYDNPSYKQDKYINEFIIYRLY